MPGCCVVRGCSNTASLEHCIALHRIPLYGDTRSEAKKRRKRWIDFVKMKRGKWEPSKSSVICSRHFQPTDFEHRFNFLPGQRLQFPRLKMVEFGVSVYPTVHAGTEQNPQGERLKRKVRIFLWSVELWQYGAVRPPQFSLFKIGNNFAEGRTVNMSFSLL